MREIEVEVIAKTPRGLGKVALLRSLNSSLHELNQPITVLLCTLEYGAQLDSISEIKALLLVAQKASQRVRTTALAMRNVFEDARREGQPGMVDPIGRSGS